MAKRRDHQSGIPGVTGDRYINPFTDFGFKRLFGEEPHKFILLDFLNTLLADEQAPIAKLTYLKNEQLGAHDRDRRAIFDLYCESESGEKFIVEMQKAKHNFFKERSVYYSTFPIRDQALKGEWDFNLKAVYTIGILDFVFEEDRLDTDKFCYRIKLSDIETHRVFYNKLTLIYLEMPKFCKAENELETNFDKWMYVLKNLPNLQRRPERLQEKVFQKLFEIAEIARFTPAQSAVYEESLKVYRDLKGVLDTAHSDGYQKGIRNGTRDGIQQGIQQGYLDGEKQGIEKGRHDTRLTIARQLLATMDDRAIARITGLTIEEISALRDRRSSNSTGADT